MNNLIPYSDKLSFTDSYLSRYAACMFWMSRYMGRVENLARLMDVTYTFSPASQNEQNWQSVLAIHQDESIFAERYLKLSAINVIRFYFTDDSHQNSIMSCLHMARVNASQLRAVISTEMWAQINTLYNNVVKLAARTIAPQDLAHILADIRKQCQMFSGATEGGLYRDQGWFFYLIGKHLERADQTTRLLDIKYHLLLPYLEAIGSTVDAAQWFALLRAASGYHAFRREYPHLVTPSTVAQFLLLDKRFPRSVTACISAVDYALIKLHTQFRLEKAQGIIELNGTLLSQLTNDSIENIIEQGLHEYLDRIQLNIINISHTISEQLF
jgi:uncharacterized alpha-E superfamily protein